MNHKAWMQKALRLAEKGRPRVSPNPMVGACVVKNGRLIAAGYHENYGGPHAEVAALRRAGTKARGATLYVTLEPCATWGKTPPCVAAILKAGIRRVVIGSKDPNPKNYGRGVQALRQAGLQVLTGILASEVKAQNESFFKLAQEGLPFLTLKMAQSLDGKIATRKGQSRWITSTASRKFVHRLRAEQDAILIGRQTFLQDNPSLTVRVGGRNGLSSKPWRVVLGRMRDFKNPRAALFQGPQLTLLVVSEREIANSRKFTRGKIFLSVPERNHRLELRNLLRKLAALGVAKLLVEGGGELAWSLLRENLVDRIVWVIAPSFLGGRTAKTSVEGEGVSLPSKAIRCRRFDFRRLGDDLVVEGRF